MRLFIFTLLLSVSVSPLATAQDSAPDKRLLEIIKTRDAPATAESAVRPRAAVIADEETGVVRIVIEGQEVARFTLNGFHVRNDIHFGGVLSDVGIANYGIDDTPSPESDDAP